MASSQQLRGTGRGRGRQPSHPPGAPSMNVSASTVSKTTDTNIPSTSIEIPLTVTTQVTTTSDTSCNPRQEIEPSDPHWTVSTKTNFEFMSNDRPSKSTELGKIGIPIEVMVNYFPILQFPKEGLVYRYDIKIQNKRSLDIPRRHRRVLYDCWLRKFCGRYPQIDRHKVVFDNYKIVLAYDQPLPDINKDGITKTMTGPNRANREEEYRFSIKQVGDPVDLSLLSSLRELCEKGNDNNSNSNDFQNIKQVLSIALHEHCSSHADCIYNRSFFTQPVLDRKHGEWDLGLGNALWRGFYSSLVFTKGTHQLLMNLDVIHAVFTKRQPFLDFLCEIMRHSPCGKWRYGSDEKVKQVEMRDVVEMFDRNNNGNYYQGERDFLLKHCKHLRVRSENANKTIVYDIHGLGDAASKQTFIWEQKENQSITVLNYYKEQYGIELQYPSLPTLRMRNGPFVPMEIVDIEPIKMNRITAEQRALVCRFSSLNPAEYHKSINQIRQNPKQQCFENDPFIAAWNFNVDVKMLTVPARVLPMPNIIYSDTFQITQEQCRQPGVWSGTQSQFYKPTDFPSVWAMINLSSSLDRESCEAFYNELSKVAADRGINCCPPQIYEEYNGQNYSIKQMIAALKEMMMKNDDCQFLIVILPEDDAIRDRTYGDVKKLYELEFGFGIITQMIRATTIQERRKGKKQWDYSTLNNLLLKIDTKLNGTNSTLDVSDVIQRFFIRGHRIMYVGVDLSHGGSGTYRKRSVVAVVASADDIPNRYFKEVYMQERPPQIRGESWENIVDMKEIMKSLISQYEQHRGYPPEAIVIYRDGISTSEFDSVFERELMATREACVDLSPVYRPCLTYIVVNKRHHTRFFPMDLKTNVAAGTVIDSPDVTDPTTYSFFLYSHHGQLGTSRPTYYHVLYDDNKLIADEVQMLTYALCYTYARCTSSVSVPAPVKYANSLAFRAGFYIDINEPSDAELDIPINEDVDVNITINSKRIVLSSKLAPDCPFFL